MNVQIASQQPPTTAKVILYTSHGEIDLQLWTKQAPLASKNFIQHSLNGYYNNTIFHRLIPGFMIQGGDPTGTGMGGQSIYGEPFRDQFHQRLKFTRRGILAMANAGKNTNKSQFFITFGACQHLNKKHTIFGKVVGDTIYNLMGLQSLDTGQQDKPLDPPIIRKIKVVDNPFSDIKITNELKQVHEQKEQQNKNRQCKQSKQKILRTKQQIKKLKNKKKLTFDQQQQQVEQRPKIISSHDVLYKKDQSLSNKVSISKQQIQKKRKQKQLQQKKAQQLKNSLLNRNKQLIKQQDNEDDQDVNKLISKEMNKKRVNYQKSNQHNIQNQQLLSYQKRYNPNTNKYQIVFSDQLQTEKRQQQQRQELQRKARQQEQKNNQRFKNNQKLKQLRQQQLRQYNLLKADQLNFKKAKQGSLKQKRKQIISQEIKLLSNLQKHRYQYTKKLNTDKRQGDLFKKLIGFTQRLKGIKTQSNPQANNNQNNEQVQKQQKSTVNKKNSWMNHQLKFHIDSTNAYSLQQKSKLVKGHHQQDDGGLKMQVQYNNYLQDDDQNQKQIQQVLKNL